MVRLWVSRLLHLTSLRIFVMFARLDEASVRHMLREPPEQRVTLLSVPIVRAATNGTLPHYRLMHTKLHAWSLPCARVALLDYDVIAIRDPSPIFDSCGTAKFCAGQDFSTPGPHGRVIFNGGVFVLRADNATHRRLVAAAEDDAQRGLGRPFAEQAFLNEHFRGAWRQLANRFNMQGTWTPLKQHRAVRDGVLLHQKLSQLPSVVEEALGPRPHEAAAALIERGLQALRTARFPVRRTRAGSRHPHSPQT